MATAATSVLDSKLHKSPGKLGIAIFGGVLLIGISYAAVNLVSDLSGFHSPSILPYLLLVLALLVALGFEFVNGFHDTANAVATVIYPIRSNLILRSCGLDSGTFWVCSPRAVQSPLRLSRCFRWN